MVTDPKDDPATLAMLKVMSPMVDDPRYAYEVRDALDTQGSRDGNGGVRLHAGAAADRGCHMNAHTPAPWSVVEYGDEDTPALVIHSDSENRVCFMAMPGENDDPAKIAANANLIAASPDMLDALKQMVFTHPKCSRPIGGEGSPARLHQQDQDRAIDQAKTAIASAEGRS